jgi:uncharacterized protein YlxW (UPF0749 family)
MRSDTTSPVSDPTAAQPGRRPRQIGIALAVALLGFLLATQLQSRPGIATRLAAEREADLTRLLSDLQERSDLLVGEIVDLRVKLATASNSQEQERVLLANARQQLDSLRILLGMVPVQGEGIQITIIDPEGAVGPDLLVDAVQELRDAGAEAIDVNGVRVVASTGFGGRAGAIVSGRAPVRAPFVITAIGSRSTLEAAVRIPGGVLDAVKSRSGAQATVEPGRDLRIRSLRPPPRFAYATPAA